MKRIFALVLALMLVFSLAACGEQAKPDAPLPEDPASSHEVGAADPSALQLEALNIEFVIGERDAAELMALRAELPPLLTDKLADEGVTVQNIVITFGASAEATMQALQSGSVDAAFLPSEALSGFRTRLIAVENASVPAGEYFPDIDFSEDDGVDAVSPIYENAVALSADAPDALRDAFSAALAALCADVDGSAALQHYGSASYLVSGDLGALFVPLNTCLTHAAQE